MTVSTVTTGQIRGREIQILSVLCKWNHSCPLLSGHWTVVLPSCQVHTKQRMAEIQVRTSIQHTSPGRTQLSTRRHLVSALQWPRWHTPDKQLRDHYPCDRETSLPHIFTYHFCWLQLLSDLHDCQSRFSLTHLGVTTKRITNSKKNARWDLLTCWGFNIIKGSVERSRHERHFCSLLPYFSLYWLQIFQLCLSFWTSSFDLVIF